MRCYLVALALAGCGGHGTGGVDGAQQGSGFPITQAEAESACRAYGLCSFDDGINDCFTDALPYLSAAAIRCLAAHEHDCAGALACVGLAVTPMASSCAASCDGNTSVRCDLGFIHRQTCGAELTFGPNCVASSSSATCLLGSCTAAMTSCDGTKATSCRTVNGLLEQVDCGPAGFQCIDGTCTDDGSAGVVCDPATDFDHCDGNFIVTCENRNQRERRVDCARFAGSTCLASNFTVYCGYASDCAPQQFKETCAGTTLTYCGNGLVRTLDCTQYGYTTCTGHTCF
jgi:hypothetical protein